MHQSKPLAAQKCPKSPHARWRGTFARLCSLAIYFLNLRTIHLGGKHKYIINIIVMHTYLCRCHLCCQNVCFNQSKQRTISTLLAVTCHTSTRWSLSIQHVHVSAKVAAIFVLTARLVAYTGLHTQSIMLHPNQVFIQVTCHSNASTRAQRRVWCQGLWGDWHPDFDPASGLWPPKHANFGWHEHHTDMPYRNPDNFPRC